eukprot:SAG31_NODE_4007_length_3670_cov_1.628955_1_plen_131_part_00
MATPQLRLQSVARQLLPQSNNNNNNNIIRQLLPQSAPRDYSGAARAANTATSGEFKVYISADIEGVGGVVNEQHLGAGGLEYQEARTWMTLEVAAAATAALDAGVRLFLAESSTDPRLTSIVHGRAALDP